MKYEKKNKNNLFKNVWLNIADSNRGLLNVMRESSTMKRLIPIEILAGLVFGLTTKFIVLEYIILLVALIILVTMEVVNSSIEEVNDLVTEEFNERVKRSKDMASAGVWIWHIVYILCAVFFFVCHLIGFSWWESVIPGN